MFPWWVASLVGSISIAATEYLHRSGGFTSWFQAFPYMVWLYLITGAALYYAWRDAPSFLFAWVVLFCFNTALRMASAHLLVGESLNLMTTTGIALVLAGAYCIKAGTS